MLDAAYRVVSMRQRFGLAVRSCIGAWWVGHTPVLFSRDALLAHVLACGWPTVSKKSRFSVICGDVKYN
eukprot:4963415-Prymnesium_polylepis.1